MLPVPHRHNEPTIQDVRPVEPQHELTEGERVHEPLQEDSNQDEHYHEDEDNEHVLEQEEEDRVHDIDEQPALEPEERIDDEINDANQNNEVAII